MGSVRDNSDDEYSVIGDKGDIGFIDYANCSSVCDYNPDDESQVVNISVPFPMVNGKPQSGIAGETISDCVTIKNLTNEPLDLWSVSIYDSKPEGSFRISLVDPTTVDSDEQFSTYFDDLVVKANRDFKFWVSCEPKEIGLYSSAVHVNVGDETIERLMFVLAEDKISKSLSSSKPYQRSRRKKQEVVNVDSADAAFVVGRRPSKGSKGGNFKKRLPDYPIPRQIREMVSNEEIPDVVGEGLNDKNYGSFFKTLLAMEEIHMEDDMRAYDMELVHLMRKRNMYLTLEVPGLAEKRPSLVSGDFILAKLANEDETRNETYQGYIHRVEAEEDLGKMDGGGLDTGNTTGHNTNHSNQVLQVVKAATNATPAKCVLSLDDIEEVDISTQQLADMVTCCENQTPYTDPNDVRKPNNYKKFDHTDKLKPIFEYDDDNLPLSRPSFVLIKSLEDSTSLNAGNNKSSTSVISACQKPSHKLLKVTRNRGPAHSKKKVGGPCPLDEFFWPPIDELRSNVFDAWLKIGFLVYPKITQTGWIILIQNSTENGWHASCGNTGRGKWRMAI